VSKNNVTILTESHATGVVRLYINGKSHGRFFSHYLASKAAERILGSKGAK
jgi:hypothetical protein